MPTDDIYKYMKYKLFFFLFQMLASIHRAQCYWFQFWIAMLFLPKLGKFFCPDFNKLLVSLRLLLPTLKDDEECHSPGCFDKQTMHNVQYAGIFTKKVFNTLAQISRNLHLKVGSLLRCCYHTCYYCCCLDGLTALENYILLFKGIYDSSIVL